MNFVDIQLPCAVYRNPGDLASAFFQCLAKLDVSRMLYNGGDDVAFTRLGGQGTIDSGVVALGSATGKNDFTRIGIDKCGNFFACFGYCVTGSFPESISTGRVAPLLCKIG